MSARQNQRIPHVAHTDDAFAARIFGVLIGRRFVQILVFDPVDFLQQIIKSVDEYLLLERPQGVRSVSVMVDHTDGGV